MSNESIKELGGQWMQINQLDAFTIAIQGYWLNEENGTRNLYHSICLLGTNPLVLGNTCGPTLLVLGNRHAIQMAKLVENLTFCFATPPDFLERCYSSSDLIPLKLLYLAFGIGNQVLWHHDDYNFRI